ncbi:CDP-diacylglycerol--serine O-phosphatidyltransferase [Shewanella sp. D64]|uniref:CDP-diacylglycerol--serine O-phosphatidyltransferase n=1 Tax=unclassified Shewanella TaxID=196818 RepID=UPI0022BA49D4|nr:MULTISPECIES: CDP-diacylglycerol--serine O-phosphatidyltransferase [unclassified Shewanella]MEC4724084.1 CDP-diacylglycerol--serine O-phosphatidyltransferase [Shewanella sp. D64]MEC4736104.1 CDP-diacylglycerol--serine O-phosphatidyltransferase [Shewanella sp. E94]WBJ97952.1 CDP-diacylglycerol--serine O-phosphatidyltransferase [Shewanella sp. MTB7]
MLDKLGGIPLQPEAIRWLLTPKCLKAELLTSIANAKNAVYISALYLEDDEAGREILAALMQAKDQNPALDVKVLVDFHRARRGLIGHKGDSGNYLMYRKVNAEAKHPIEILGVPVKSREFMGVLHLKGFIIDDTVIYSGASINNIYLHENEKYRFDRYHVIESAELARSMRQMIQTYLVEDVAVCSLTQDKDSEQLPEKVDIRSLKTRLSKAGYQYEQTRIGNRITPVMGLGRKKNKLNKIVVDLVAESKESLFICTPYFNPPYILARSLAKHLRDGKRIDIVVGDKTANDFYIPPEQDFSTIGALPYLYEQSLRKFAKKQQWAIENGQLNIHLWKDGINSYHLKGISADGRRHLITGSNLNPRAWSLDLENGLLIQDENGCWQEQFEAEQAHILQHTERLYHYSQIDTLNSYPAPVRKIMTRIRRLKADFLLRRIL